jgi:hypothetical protein
MPFFDMVYWSLALALILMAAGFLFWKELRRVHHLLWSLRKKKRLQAEEKSKGIRQAE